jgi:hypothetical protein
MTGLVIIALGVVFIRFRHVLSAIYPDWVGYTPRRAALMGLAVLIAGLIVLLQPLIAPQR